MLWRGDDPNEPASSPLMKCEQPRSLKMGNGEMQPMTKGYWIAQVDVHDAEAYRGYVEANAIAFAKYGARFLVRGGAVQKVEGQSRSRIVVLEFKDYATALACYHSPGIHGRRWRSGRKRRPQMS